MTEDRQRDASFRAGRHRLDGRGFRSTSQEIPYGPEGRMQSREHEWPVLAQVLPAEVILPEAFLVQFVNFVRGQVFVFEVGSVDVVAAPVAVVDQRLDFRQPAGT